MTGQQMVQVWFGRTAIATYVADPEHAARYAAAMDRRFPGLPITTVALAHPPANTQPQTARPRTAQPLWGHPAHHTTLVAAERLGRRAIGIECDECCGCRVIAERLAQDALPFDHPSAADVTGGAA